MGNETRSASPPEFSGENGRPADIVVRSIAPQRIKLADADDNVLLDLDVVEADMLLWRAQRYVADGQPDLSETEQYEQWLPLFAELLSERAGRAISLIDARSVSIATSEAMPVAKKNSANASTSAADSASAPTPST